MGFLFNLFGIMSHQKEELLRHLVKEGILTEIYSPASTASEAYTMSCLKLLGTPQSTIVTCVESWAQLRLQGFDDVAISHKIAAYRKVVARNDVEAVIDNILCRELGMAVWGLLSVHFEYCKSMAKNFYGIQ